MANTLFFLEVSLLVVATVGEYDDRIRNVTRLQEIFYENCPIAMDKSMPTALRYQNPELSPVRTNITMSLFRFIEIDDLEQRLSLYIEIKLRWTIAGCDIDSFCGKLRSESLILNESACPEKFGYYFYHDANTNWFPKIDHENAFKDTDILTILGRRQNRLIIDPFINVAAMWLTGRIDTACSEFSFQSFPFDELECNITFATFEETEILLIDKATQKISSLLSQGFIGESEVWGLVEPIAEGIVEVSEGSNIINFPLKFKRKYFYYLSTIILPTYLIYMLQIATLIMPPELPDRPAYSITVMIASSVMLSIVFSGIPRTSESVYLAHVVLSKQGCGVVITFYALITCAIPEDKGKQIRDFLSIRITIRRLFDVAAFFIILSFSIISDLAYFILMTS